MSPAYRRGCALTTFIAVQAVRAGIIGFGRDGGLGEETRTGSPTEAQQHMSSSIEPLRLRGRRATDALELSSRKGSNQGIGIHPGVDC